MLERANTADTALATISAASAASWNGIDVARRGIGKAGPVASATVTSAMAVTMTMSTYERSEPLCIAGATRRLSPSRPASVKVYRNSARSAAGHCSRHRRAREAKRAIDPARVNALSASVGVKPCHRVRAAVDWLPVTASLARAIGPAPSAGTTPRTTPIAPRTSGPSHIAGGASWAAGVGAASPRKGAMPAISPAAPRHMLAATTSDTSTPLPSPGSVARMTLS